MSLSFLSDLRHAMLSATTVVVAACFVVPGHARAAGTCESCNTSNTCNTRAAPASPAPACPSPCPVCCQPVCGPILWPGMSVAAGAATRTVRVTRYRPETREHTVVAYRTVPETENVQEQYTVLVPQSRTRTVVETVNRPVYRDISLQITRLVPHTETRQATRPSPERAGAGGANGLRGFGPLAIPGRGCGQSCVARRGARGSASRSRRRAVVGRRRDETRFAAGTDRGRQRRR